METTDTQPVNTDAQVRSALASVLTPNAVQRTAAQPQQPATPVQAPPPTAPTPETPTATGVAATQAPEVPAPTPVAPDTPDPYAAVVDTMFGSAPAVATWDDGAKAAFKSTFGEEDPAAYKARIQSEIEQGNLWKTKYDEVAPIAERINALPDTAKKVIQLTLEGKAKEAQDYLKSTPSVLLDGKPAKNIDKVALTRAYFGDKLTDEQWDMLDDPEAYEGTVDALKTRVDILHAAAVDKHEAALSAAANERAAEAQEKQAYAQRYHQGVATTISEAKNSPLSAFLDQGTIGEITTGEFLSKYVNADGTPTAAAATLHLYALHGQKLVQAAEERGYKRGKSDGLQDATSRMPAGPTGSGRTAGEVPNGQAQRDPVREIAMRAYQHQ